MPLGAAFHSLNLANPLAAPSDPRIFRGFVRSVSTTTVSAFNTAGTALGTAFTHGCGTLQIIRTMKLPDSNNQIIAIGGANGRRVLHFNAATNTYTSIYNSTAITAIQTCDITFNTANDKFYIAWGSSTTTTTNRVRLSTGTLSSPTTAMSETGLANPGGAVYSCAWTPNGNTLAFRTTSTIRTYYRASGDVMTLNATSYSLSGGNDSTGYEDISWNALGTVLAASNGDTSITRYSLSGSLGALTSLGASTVPGSVPPDRPIPAFNPNTSFAGVLAVGARDLVAADNTGFTFMYFGSNGSGTLNTLPGNTGQVTANTDGNAMRQVRWSPTGDRIAMLFSGDSGTLNRYYPFTYSEGSTATVATTGNSFTSVTAVNNYSFDWIYY
jgi:hypothetical protein